MDEDFIDALVLYAREDPGMKSSILDDMIEWRDAAFEAMRCGAGQATFEVTSTTQHGKSVSGQLTMTNSQAFTALTHAISKIKSGYLGSVTHVDFSNFNMR